MTSVFFLGASGYIGGSVLVDLLEKHPGLKVTAYVRTPEQAEAIRKAGATPVQGTWDDLTKITELSSQADIVIHTADCDNLDLAKAVIAGIKARYDAGKGKGKYIHTSGAANFVAGNADGTLVTDAKIWNDTSVEDIKSISSKQLHGHVDSYLINAGAEGFVDAYIVCPVVVFGNGSGPTAQQSVFFKYSIPPAVQQKTSVYVGKGEGHVNGIHIRDLVAFYDRLFNHVVAGQGKEGPYERYYILSTTHSTWKEFANALAQVLHAKGISASAEPVSVDAETLGPLGIHFYGTYFGQGDRAKQLGWAPKVTGPITDFIQEAVEFHLASEPAK